MSGALDGVRVLDLGQYVAGPLAGMLLADQGADVIKVDPPGGPRFDTPANSVWNRGKRAITLDLHSAADRDIARRLVASSDVLIENFRPGVTERLGLGPAATLAAHPGLIYCSMPGFASDDPRAGMQAWEGVVSAAAAAYSPLPRPGDTLGTDPNAPVFSAVPIASCYAAFLTCASIGAALTARRRDGLGQHVEVPLFDATLVGIGYRAQRFLDQAADPIAFAGARIIGYYECADGTWIYFHTGSKLAGAFLEAVEPGASTWAAEPGARPRLAECLARQTAQHWEDVGHQIGAEVVKVRTSAEWLAEPSALLAGLTQDVEDPVYGVMRQPGVQARLAGTPGGIRGPAPAPDGDRAAILTGLDRRRAGSGRGLGERTGRAVPVPVLVGIDGTAGRPEGRGSVDRSRRAHLRAHPVGLRGRRHPGRCAARARVAGIRDAARGVRRPERVQRGREPGQAQHRP